MQQPLTSRTGGANMSSIDRFMAIIGGAVIDEYPADDTSRIGGGTLLDEVETVPIGDPTVLVIGGSDGTRTASTAEPGLRRLFQMMQHVRPTFAEKRKKKAAAKKKKKQQSRKAKKPQRRRRQKKGGGDDNDSSDNDTVSLTVDGVQKSVNLTAFLASDDSADDLSDDSSDEMYGGSGADSDDDTEYDGGGKKPATKVKKVKQTDLYKYTDSLTDEPTDEYITDFNIAVEIDK